MVETAAPVPIRVQPSPTAVRGDPPSPPVLLEPTIVSNDSNAEAAIADLAARLDVDLSMIVLAAMDEVTWADTSLGCPEPDRAYLQVLTPGLRIVLVVGDSTYEYHSGFGGRLILCTNPRPPVM
jgi:hypothetical protein